MQSRNPERDGMPAESDLWFRENPEEERKGLEAAWFVAALADEERSFEPDPVRVQRMEMALNAAIKRPDRPSIRRIGAWRAFKMTGVLTSALVVAAILYLVFVPVTIEAPVGKVLTHRLPDGSEVELNSASRVSYSRSFALRRKISLEGEAFFDVVASNHPFRVETFNSTITVLGTRFNVRSWPEEPMAATTVILEKGRVQLATGRGEAKSVVLSPGQVSHVSGTLPSAPVPVVVNRELAWRSGGMYFVDAPVGAILDDLERRLGIDIQTRPAGLRDERASIVLDRLESAEPVLEALSEMRGWSLRPTEGGYILAREAK